MCFISINISLTFLCKDTANSLTELVQMMAWGQAYYEALFEQIPCSNVGCPKVVPTAVLSSQRWVNLIPTYIAVYDTITVLADHTANDNRVKQSPSPWWRHQMETLSAFLALCAGNSPATGEFPSQRPATRSFDVSFDLHLNKRMSKQLRRR